MNALDTRDEMTLMSSSSLAWKFEIQTVNSPDVFWLIFRQAPGFWNSALVPNLADSPFQNSKVATFKTMPNGILLPVYFSFSAFEKIKCLLDSLPF